MYVCHHFDKYKTIVSCMNKLFGFFHSVRRKTAMAMGKDEIITQNMFWSLDESRYGLSESSFLHIPNEIILHIFRYLSVPDLCNVALVCRSFKMIADLDEIWKPKCNSTSNLSFRFFHYS
jgi:hypothetical protein